VLSTRPCPKQQGEEKIKRQLEGLVNNKRLSQKPTEQQRLQPSKNVLSFRVRKSQLLRVLGEQQRTGQAGEIAVIITDHDISGPGGISVMEKGPTKTGTIILDRQIAEALALMLSAPSIKDSSLDVRVALKSNRIEIVGDTSLHYRGPAQYYSDYAPAFESESAGREKEVERHDEPDLVPATPAR
jgi:hypothetical protein